MDFVAEPWNWIGVGEKTFVFVTELSEHAKNKFNAKTLNIIIYEMSN